MQWILWHFLLLHFAGDAPSLVFILLANAFSGIRPNELEFACHFAGMSGIWPWTDVFRKSSRYKMGNRKSTRCVVGFKNGPVLLMVGIEYGQNKIIQNLGSQNATKCFQTIFQRPAKSLDSFPKFYSNPAHHHINYQSWRHKNLILVTQHGSCRLAGSGCPPK